MVEQWAAGSKLLSDKMAALGKLLQDYGGSGSVLVRTTPIVVMFLEGRPYFLDTPFACFYFQEELRHVHVTGVTAGATLQFFQTVLNDQSAQRLQRALDTACSALETLVRAVIRSGQGLLDSAFVIQRVLSLPVCSSCCSGWRASTGGTVPNPRRVGGGFGAG